MTLVQHFLISLFTVGAITACNGESERYEEIQKLRALGVAADPVIPAPGATVALIFYASGPQGLTIAASPYEDAGNKYAEQMPVTIDTASLKETQVGPLSLYEVKASMVVPPAETLPINPVKGFNRLRYGLTMAAGDEREDIVGDVLSYPETAVEHSWQAPQVVIDEPFGTEGVAKGKITLKASITKPQDEIVRLGWFVSDGKVKNRRSNDTNWEPKNSGTQAVILTGRGTKSGGFSLKAVKVEVQ